ncbi:hypothetical protein PENTCL1PPCAC_16694 [Pristionchus entomophagus]|uniref:G protein-coupled receptor n=1 Tax=Pristionchus entomophagus TaxID=358040 RepID=A0AAV5TJN3_9BILA|nr:hypothetical protein PENTCL1PPCAC_16694 [Pristionchus entomophagus]
MPNLSLHPLWHTVMPAYQHFVGIVTHLLSALAFYLMLYKTPNSGKAFAKYLMLLQASITLVDLNFGLLASPVALFPVPGGLCNGIICTWFGFTGHAGITVMFFAVAFVAIALIYCFHYRFVSIGHILGQDSFEAPRHSAFRAIIFVVYTIPCVLQIGLYRNIDGGPLFVKTVRNTMFPFVELSDRKSGLSSLCLRPNSLSGILNYCGFLYDICKLLSTKRMMLLFVQIMILAILIVFYFVVYSFISLSRQVSLELNSMLEFVQIIQ